MPQDIFALAAFENKRELPLRYFLPQRAKQRLPSSHMRGMTVYDHAIHVKNDGLQHAVAPNVFSAGSLTIHQPVVTRATKSALPYMCLVYQCRADIPESRTPSSVRSTTEADES